MHPDLAQKIVQTLGPHRLRKLLGILAWLKPRELQITLALAGLVGWVGGLASILFRRCVEWVHWAMTGHWQTGLADSFAHLETWQRILIPVGGGAAAGLVLMISTRSFLKKQTTDYMEAVVIGDGYIPVRRSLLKSLSALFSIASGASIGKEGPIVQLAAMLGSLVSRGVRVSTPRLRLLVACGAAAGIASAYNAPISGALFVAEIVLGTTSMEIFGPLVFSSVIATLTIRRFSEIGTLYEVGPIAFDGSSDLFLLLLLGCICGLLCPVYLWILRKVETGFSAWNVPVALRLATGGLVVGVIAVWYPQVCGNGYSSVEAVLHGSWPWTVLAVILVLKVVATSAAFGSGAVGGIFTPTLFTGSAMGFLFGTLMQSLWGTAHTTSVVVFALVGMGAFLAASTRAPIMAIILIFELTLDYEVILPLMLACVAAYYVARSFPGKGIYNETLRRKGRWEFDSQLQSMRAGDIMRKNPPTVGLTASFDEICRQFTAMRHNYLYVVESDHRFAGVISLHDVKYYLSNPDLASMVISRDVLRKEFPSLRPEDYLATVFERFAHHESERLPVLSDQGILLGSVSKADALLAFAEQSTQGTPQAAA